MAKKHSLAEKLLGKAYEAMDERTEKVARHITERKHISKNPSKALDGSAAFVQCAADAVAKFGGFWVFIMLFAAVFSQQSKLKLLHLN